MPENLKICFNHMSAQEFLSQKHLKAHVNDLLNFQEHLTNILSQVNRTVGLFNFFL